MAKKMLIDATHPEETRVVVADGNRVDEFDFESLNKRQLAGNIYLAKVTRVEPSLQAAFIEYGGNRHGFLAFSEIHPDYYQIPKADRDAILAEERAYAEAQAALDEAAGADSDDASDGDGDGDGDGAEAGPTRSRSRSRTRSRSRRRDDGGEDAADGDEADEADEAVLAQDGDDAVVSGGAAEVSEAAAGDDDGPVTTIAESTGLEDETVEGDVAGMETVDAEEADDAEPIEDPAPKRSRGGRGRKKAPAEKDERVEAVGEDDPHDDARAPRVPRPRARKYNIQEVVKVRQIMLVQVVKEERGNKGAAMTTYLSLAGRYCVLMPNTARGGGISRKITNAPDRKKLKEIAQEIDVPQGAGLIVRTAGAKRTKTEIKRDYEYLKRQWEQVRALTLKSIAPSPIYEEGNLIHRSIRDLYSRDIDEVIVDGDAGYREAKDYMRLIMPGHAKNVVRHEGPQPLFAKHGVESYLAAMFSPTVQLPSGGYIVIGITEALVAVDVNSGKSTREGSIEDTATKTNLEAADEVARQMRLRDLAGLIVIDFIDMDDRRNNAAVEKRMKDALKGDRARIQMGRISGFGLMEMSRQRLRPGMLEATTQACSHCHGTGLIRSDDSVALQVLRALEEEGGRGRSKEVVARLPVKVANFLMNDKRDHLGAIERRYGMAVRIEADPTIVGDEMPPFEKSKTSTRVIAPASAAIHADTSWTSADDARVEAEALERDEEAARAEAEEAREADAAEAEVEAAPAARQGGSEEERSDGDGEGEGGRRKRRRRSRRRKGGGEGSEPRAEADAEADGAGGIVTDTGEAILDDSADARADEAEPESEEPKPRSRSRSRSRSRKPVEASEPSAEGEATETLAEAVAEVAQPEPAADEKPKRGRSRSRAKAPATEEAPEAGAGAVIAAAADMAEAAVEAVAKAVEPKPEAEPAAAESEPEPEAAAAPEEPEPEAKPAKAKRRGWWSFGS